MRHYPIFLLLTLFLCTSGRAQDTVRVNSEITEATVYLTGAQVTRTAASNVAEGRQVLIFTGLTPDLDPGSIQVNSEGRDFTVLSVSHRLNFGKLKLDERRESAWDERLDRLARRKARVRTQIKIAQDEEKILAANQVVAGQEQGLKADELRATVAYQRERLTAIRMSYLDYSDSLRIIADLEEAVALERAAAGKQEEVKTTAEILVTTQAERATRSDFKLSYLTADASWTPHYDARVASIAEPVELRYRAKVRQNTREDWTNVRLKLSTGDPSVSAKAPFLSTWRLTNGSRPPAYVPGQKSRPKSGYREVSGYVKSGGEPLIGASLEVVGTSMGAVTDLDGYYELNLPTGENSLRVSYTGFAQKLVPVTSDRMDITLEEEAAMLEEVVVVGYAGAGSSNRKRKQGDRRMLRDQVSGMAVAPPAPPVPVATIRKATTVSFDIEIPYTIPSDGVARDVDIQRYQLPAIYTHFTVPKFEEAAFLTAAVTGWDKYDLLTGEVNLFFEGTFLGASQLDISSTSDTLELSLGRDPNVIVQRTELDDFQERSFFGDKRTQKRAYQISVRNTKPQPINLIVRDQVPISGDERIDVEYEIGGGGAREKNTGILTWRTTVAPNTDWAASFNYAVKYPKSLRVLLE